MGVHGEQSAPSTVCRIGRDNLTCFGVKDGFGCIRGLSNTIDKRGDLWIGSANGICELEPGGRHQFYPLRALMHHKGFSPISSIVSGSDGALWAGTERRGLDAGLLRFQSGRWGSFVTGRVDGRRLSVSTLLAGVAGSLWIGTTDQGLFRLFDGHLEHINTDDGLSAQHVLSIFRDREGGLWVATPMGIDYFRDDAILSLSSDQDMKGDRAWAITADRRGTVFLGSSTLATLTGRRLRRFTDQHGQPLNDIQFLFTDSRDDIWIAADGRLLRLQGEHTLSPVAGFPLTGAIYISYIVEDANHDIWVAADDTHTRTSSLAHIRGLKVAEMYKQTMALHGQTVNALAADPAGGLWVGGSAHGLFHFAEGQFTSVPTGGLDERVENLLEDPDEALWIVTPNGFVRYSGAVAKRLGTANGLPCNSGVNIQNDQRGSHWFYMHCGIMRVSDEQLRRWWRNEDATVHGTLFGAEQGARPNLSDSSPVQTPDGRLWSASDYEYQVIDPRHLPFNHMPPPVTLEMFTADGKGYPVDHALSLPAQTHQVEIQYAGLSYLIPDLVRFRYRLQGLNAGWIDAGTRRNAFYNILAPGHYVFHVIACNNDGVWDTRGAIIAFTIPPVWYQTMIFRILAALLLIMLVTGAYLYRLHRYAAILKMRFDERLEERTRLSRDLHDTLLQTVQGSKMVADEAREHVNDPKLTAHALERLSEWLNRAILEGRAALDELRISSIEVDDLIGALRRAAADCSQFTAIVVNTSTTGSMRKLHPVARDEVYRMGYEAIRNACTHSAATDLWISIDFRRTFRLEVRDNGRGIEEQILRVGRRGHFGLTGMKERAASLGGQLTISNEFTGGVVVSLSVPGVAVYRPRSLFGSIRSYLPRWISRRRDANGS